jgi:hypothetical protein
MAPPLHSYAKCSNMTCIVPQPDHRLGHVVFVTQGTHASGAQEEVSAGSGLEPEPSSCWHAQEVPAGKEQDVPMAGSHSAHHVVGPDADHRQKNHDWHGGINDWLQEGITQVTRTVIPAAGRQPQPVRFSPITQFCLVLPGEAGISSAFALRCHLDARSKLDAPRQQRQRL